MTDNNNALFHVLFLQIRADSLLQSKEPKQTSARMHTHTHISTALTNFALHCCRSVQEESVILISGGPGFCPHHFCFCCTTPPLIRTGGLSVCEL